MDKENFESSKHTSSEWLLATLLCPSSSQGLTLPCSASAIISILVFCQCDFVVLPKSHDVVYRESQKLDLALMCFSLHEVYHVLSTQANRWEVLRDFLVLAFQ